MTTLALLVIASWEGSWLISSVCSSPLCDYGYFPPPQNFWEISIFETSIIFGWKWSLIGWAGDVIK